MKSVLGAHGGAGTKGNPPWLEGEAVLGLRLFASSDANEHVQEPCLAVESYRVEKGADGSRLVSLIAPTRRGETSGAQEGEAKAIASFEGLAPDTLTLVRSPLWLPYRLGAFTYEPLSALARRIADLRNHGDEEGLTPFGAETAALALWSWLESDLVRFARDDLLRRACDAARGDPERARFAAFNDLARDVLRFMLPWGVAPARWHAWLRGEPPRALPKGKVERPGVPAGRRDAARFRDGLVRVLTRAGRCSVEVTRSDLPVSDA